jgi:hypothetical protein
MECDKIVLLRCFWVIGCHWCLEILAKYDAERGVEESHHSGRASCWRYPLCRSCVAHLGWSHRTLEWKVIFKIQKKNQGDYLHQILKNLIDLFRFYSLWDTGYAKIHIPIIASVSEHQPTTWFSFFFDLHILVCTFPVGLWYCIKNINDERVFVALYALSAVYFAGVMVRLMLTLTPVVCILAGIAFSGILDIYLKEEEVNEKPAQSAAAGDDATQSGNKNMYDKVRHLPL